MSPSYSVVNFLDTRHECENVDPQPEGHTVAQRPWKLHWPPKKDSELWNWLSSEAPDALTWRFNPAEPFNRPWHKWTKAAALKGATCSSLLPQKSTRTDTGCSGTFSTHPRADDFRGYVVQLNTNLILVITEDNATGHSRPIESPKEVFSRNGSASNSKVVHDKIEELSLPSVTSSSFTYLSPLEFYNREKPYYSRLPFLNGLRRTNVVGKSCHDVQVFDISSKEEFFRLDETGFEYVKVPVSTDRWTDTFVREEYLPKMAQWLEAHFRCEKAHIYAYNV